MNRFFFSFLQRLQAPTHLMRIPPSILPWPFWNYSLDEIRCLGAPFSEVAKPQIYTEPNHQQNACFFGGVFGRILRFTLFYPIVFMGKYPSLEPCSIVDLTLRGSFRSSYLMMFLF